MNFSRKSKEFGVSIAYLENEEFKAGAIYLPALDLMYSGAKNEPSKVDDRIITLKPTNNLRESIITGCLPMITPQSTKVSFAVAQKVRTFKVYHCAVYSITRILEGEADAYIHSNISEWDFAAGKIILESAGGKVTNQYGKPWKKGDYLVASNGKIHEQLCKLIRENQSAESKGL